MRGRRAGHPPRQLAVPALGKPRSGGVALPYASASDHPRAVQLPFDQQAVGRRAGVDALHGAVIIGQIGRGGGAQVADVQLGVGGAQRVDRPAHLRDAALQAPVALEPFQARANPQPAPVFQGARICECMVAGSRVGKPKISPTISPPSGGKAPASSPPSCWTGMSISLGVGMMSVPHTCLLDLFRRDHLGDGAQLADFHLMPLGGFEPASWSGTCKRFMLDDP